MEKYRVDGKRGRPQLKKYRVKGKRGRPQLQKYSQREDKEVTTGEVQLEGKEACKT